MFCGFIITALQKNVCHYFLFKLYLMFKNKFRTEFFVTLEAKVDLNCEKCKKQASKMSSSKYHKQHQLKKVFKYNKQLQYTLRNCNDMINKKGNFKLENSYIFYSFSFNIFTIFFNRKNCIIILEKQLKLYRNQARKRQSVLISKLRSQEEEIIRSTEQVLVRVNEL